MIITWIVVQCLRIASVSAYRAEQGFIDTEETPYIVIMNAADELETSCWN